MSLAVKDFLQLLTAEKLSELRNLLKPRYYVLFTDFLDYCIEPAGDTREEIYRAATKIFRIMNKKYDIGEDETLPCECGSVNSDRISIDKAIKHFMNSGHIYCVGDISIHLVEN